MKKRNDLFICLGVGFLGVPLMVAVATLAFGRRPDPGQLLGVAGASGIGGWTIHLLRYQREDEETPQSGQAALPEPDDLSRQLQATQLLAQRIERIGEEIGHVKQAMLEPGNEEASPSEAAFSIDFGSNEFVVQPQPTHRRAEDDELPFSGDFL